MGIWTTAKSVDSEGHSHALEEVLWEDAEIPRCFYCIEPFDGTTPFVYWMGPPAIALHPSCAEKLGASLIADAREADLARGRWPRRSSTVIRTLMAKQIAAEHEEG